jgi:hypothetical protein
VRPPCNAEGPGQRNLLLKVSLPALECHEASFICRLRHDTAIRIRLISFPRHNLQPLRKKGKMSSSDYNYDAEGQFYPFFILTIAGLITLPLTYNVFKADTNVEAAAPPAEYNYKPEDEDLIQESKRKAKRRERKIKRMLAAVVGYLVMAGMVYLIIVTARITPRIYDPYDILGVSRVCLSPRLPLLRSWGTPKRIWEKNADSDYRVLTKEPSKNSTISSP